MDSVVVPVKTSRLRWVALYGLCIIAAAAAVRRIVALLLPAVPLNSAQYAYLDAQFASHRALTLAHIIPALVFVVLLPAWFARSIRQNARAYRRLSRILLVLGAIIGLTALPMAARPVGGTTELSAVLVFDTVSTRLAP